MSIPFTGILARSGGVLGAIGRQVKLLNLQPTKKITVQFDPFYEKVKYVRLDLPLLLLLYFINLNI